MLPSMVWQGLLSIHEASCRLLCSAQYSVWRAACYLAEVSHSKDLACICVCNMHLSSRIEALPGVGGSCCVCSSSC